MHINFIQRWMFWMQEVMIIFLHVLVVNVLLMALIYGIASSYYQNSGNCPSYNPQARIPTSRPDRAIFCAPEIFVLSYERCKNLDCAIIDTQNFLNRSIGTNTSLMIENPPPLPPKPAPLAPTESYSPSVGVPQAAPTPASIQQPAPPASETTKTEQKDSPYYVKFTAKGKERKLVTEVGTEGYPPHGVPDRGHKKVIEKIHVLSSAPLPSREALNMDIIIDAMQVETKKYTTDIKYNDGNQWFRGKCEIKVTEVPPLGNTGSLAGNGTCQLLSTGANSTSTTKLSGLEFNVKMENMIFNILD